MQTHAYIHTRARALSLFLYLSLSPFPPNFVLIVIFQVDPSPTSSIHTVLRALTDLYRKRRSDHANGIAWPVIEKVPMSPFFHSRIVSNIS